MAVIKGLSGNVSISVNGAAPVAFTDYGVAPASIDPPAENPSEIMVGQVVRFVDDTSPENIEITTTPNRFAAYVQDTNAITIDTRTLLEEDASDLTAMTFSYTRSGGSAPGVVDVTINFRANISKFNLFARDRSYYPERNPLTDEIEVYEYENTRKIYVSLADAPAGVHSDNGTWTAEAIAAHEGVAEDTLTRGWLRNRDVAGSNPTVKWGEDPKYAFRADAVFPAGNNAGLNIAEQVRDQLTNDGAQLWLLFEAGYDYSTIGQALNPGEIAGESPLHPAFVGSYGSGTPPILFGAKPKGDNIVYRNLVFKGAACDIQRCTNVCLDGIEIQDHELVCNGGSKALSDGITARRVNGFDSRYIPYFQYDASVIDYAYQAGNRIGDHPNYTSISTLGTVVPLRYGTGPVASITWQSRVLQAGKTDKYEDWETRAADHVLQSGEQVSIVFADAKGNSERFACIGQTWAASGQTPRQSGTFVNKCMDVKFEGFYLSGSGYAYLEGYRPDRSWDAGHAMGDRSHGIYNDSQTYGVIYEDVLVSNPAHNALQARGGAIVLNFAAWGFNGGLAPIGNGGRAFSFIDRAFQTEPGFKMHDDNGAYTARFASGLSIDAPEASLALAVQFNARPDLTPVWSSEDELVQVYPRRHPNVNVTLAGRNRPYAIDETFDRSGEDVQGTESGDIVWWGWNEANLNDGTPATQGIDGLDKPTLDALGVGDWGDNELGLTGADRHDVDAALRDLKWTASPAWKRIRSFDDYVTTPLGRNLPALRSSAALCKFQPGRHVPADCHVPYLALIARNWSTNDKPGTAVGDVVDLMGHPKVPFNMTPDNQWAELRYGVGGGIEQWGGFLSPAMFTVPDGGATHELYRGARLRLPGQILANKLTVPAFESQVWSDATVTGPLDLSMYGKGEMTVYSSGDLTIPAGSTLEVGGVSRVGFDGDNAGNADLRIDGNLVFGKSVTFQIENTVEYYDRYDVNPGNPTSASTKVPQKAHPSIGDTIEGQTSGATGIVSFMTWDGGTDRIIVRLDMVTGQFQAGETILGPTWCAHEFLGDTRLPGQLGKDLSIGATAAQTNMLQPLGTVRSNGFGDYTLSTIREWHTGRYNRFDRDVNSRVSLGSSAFVSVPDTSGVTGPVDLIDVDSLTDDGASLPDGASVLGNRLVLTL